MTFCRQTKPRGGVGSTDTISPFSAVQLETGAVCPIGQAANQVLKMPSDQHGVGRFPTCPSRDQIKEMHAKTRRDDAFPLELSSFHR